MRAPPNAAVRRAGDRHADLDRRQEPFGLLAQLLDGNHRARGSLRRISSRSRVVRTVSTAISAPENRPWIISNPTTISNSEPMLCPGRSIRYMFVIMSTRPPPPTTVKKSYITPDGAERLRSELEQLWTRERPRVTQEVSDAAAQGDRSENAEYIYGKRRLREIDRRVRFLSKTGSIS